MVGGFCFMFVVKENIDFQGGFPLLVYFGFLKALALAVRLKKLKMKKVQFQQ